MFLFHLLWKRVVSNYLNLCCAYCFSGYQLRIVPDQNPFCNLFSSDDDSSPSLDFLIAVADSKESRRFSMSSRSPLMLSSLVLSSSSALVNSSRSSSLISTYLEEFSSRDFVRASTFSSTFVSTADTTSSTATLLSSR